MSTLDQINGEALALPGLRVWGRRVGGRCDAPRMRLIAQNNAGAIEIWSLLHYPAAGGVAVHSPCRPPGNADEPDECDVLEGRCWVENESIPFVTEFLPLIRRGDSAGVLRTLGEWHHRHFHAQEL